MPAPFTVRTEAGADVATEAGAVVAAESWVPSGGGPTAPFTVTTEAGADVATEAGAVVAAESWVPSGGGPTVPYTVATEAGADVATEAGVVVAVESWIGPVGPALPLTGSSLITQGLGSDSLITQGYGGEVSFHGAIYSRLTGTPEITSLVGPRIYLDHPPQQWRPAVGPTLCYTVDDDTADLNLDGPDGTSIAAVSFDAYGLRKSDTIDIARALIGAWNGFSEVLEGIEIDYVANTAGPSSAELVIDGTDARTWITTVQFEFGRQLT